MNARELAEARRVDAWLAEIHGDGVPADLAQRVQLRVRAEPVPQPRTRGFAAAALIAFGALAVVGTLLLHFPAAAEPAAAPQEPSPHPVRIAAVTTADLLAAGERLVDLPATGDATQALLELAPRIGVAIVMPGGLHAELHRGGHALPWRTAVARIAADLRLGVQEYGPVLTLVPDGKSLPYAAPLTFAAADVDVRTFARAISGHVGVALVVADGVRGRVRCDLAQASWRDALDAVAQQLDAVVEGCGAVLVLRPRPGKAAPASRLSVSFVDRGAAEVVDRLAHTCGLNVLISGTMSGAVTLHATTISVQAGPLDPRDLLTGIATGLEHRHVEGIVPRASAILRITDRVEVTSPADVNGEDIDLRTFAELVRSSTGLEVAVPADVKERFAVFANAAPLADLLRAAALATGHRFVQDDAKGSPTETRLRIE